MKKQTPDRLVVKRKFEQAIRKIARHPVRRNDPQAMVDNALAALIGNYQQRGNND